MFYEREKESYSGRNVLKHRTLYKHTENFLLKSEKLNYGKDAKLDNSSSSTQKKAFLAHSHGPAWAGLAENRPIQTSNMDMKNFLQ